MALDGSYTGLKASIVDWLNRADLAATVPDFIALGEADMARKLVMAGAPKEMIVRAEAEIDDEYETTPPDFMGAVSIAIQGTTKPLNLSRPEDIASMKINYPSQSGNPTAYAILGTEFQFWPAPTASLMVDLVYIQRFQNLNDSIVSNWLLTLHPDAYLYHALIQSAPYLKDDNRLQVWQSKADAAIQSICQSGRRGMAAPHLAMPIRTDIA